MSSSHPIPHPYPSAQGASTAGSVKLTVPLHRWRDEAVRAGRRITRIALAFEAGGDGFWLARWLEARGVEAHVIHPSSIAVSREHRRAKTDRLDTELLKRGLFGAAARRTEAARVKNEERPSRSEQQPATNQKQLFDRKTLYKFDSISLQRVSNEPGDR